MPQTPTSSSPNVIMLKGGVGAPVAALRLGWALEDRGIVFRAQEGRLAVSAATGGKADLTPGDRDAIRKWKPHLLALAAYNPPE